MSGYRELAVERGSYSAEGSYRIVDQGNLIDTFDFSSFVGPGNLEDGILECKRKCDDPSLLNRCKSFTFYEIDELNNEKYRCHIYEGIGYMKDELTGCEEIRYVKSERPDLVNNTQKPRTFYKHAC